MTMTETNSFIHTSVYYIFMSMYIKKNSTKLFSQALSSLPTGYYSKHVWYRVAHLRMNTLNTQQSTLSKCSTSSLSISLSLIIFNNLLFTRHTATPCAIPLQWQLTDTLFFLNTGNKTIPTFQQLLFSST